MSNVTQFRPVESDTRDACRRIEGKRYGRTDGRIKHDKANRRFSRQWQPVKQLILMFILRN